MKVLIIDADSVARTALECAARLGGAGEIQTTDTFARGWSCLADAERPFDVVFFDASPAAEEGAAWMRQVRAASWRHPLSLVLCTAAEPAALARAVELGVRHFVFKPSTRAAVAAKLRQIELARRYFQLEPVASPIAV